MARRRRAQVRKMLPDARYGSEMVTKFIGKVMLDGKRSLAEGIVYSAIDSASSNLGVTAMEMFQQAIDNVKPALEVKSRRVGGATYQVPVEVRPERQVTLAFRWVIAAARSRAGRGMNERLANELMDAYNNTGAAVRKKEEMHRMAEGNKAFAHYRW